MCPYEFNSFQIKIYLMRLMAKVMDVVKKII